MSGSWFVEAVTCGLLQKMVAPCGYDVDTVEGGAADGREAAGAPFGQSSPG